MKRLTAKQYLELTEIYTFPLNFFIILLGHAIAFFQFGAAFTANFFLLVLIIFVFHITMNVFNHYMDYKNASDEQYKQQTNIIGRDQLSLVFVRNFFLFHLILDLLLGLLLVFRTSWFIGLLGLFGFWVGLFYSYGKRPLNSLPIAEALTGTTSGFLITFVSYYLAIFQKYALTGVAVWQIFLISLPVSLMMFNCLLANNTCDLEEDINNHRKTLVYYLRKPLAVKVLLGAYLFSFFWLFFLTFSGLAPWTVLFLIAAFPKSWKLLRSYRKLQDKQQTFPIVLKTMISFICLYSLLYFLGSLFLT